MVGLYFAPGYPNSLFVAIFVTVYDEFDIL